MQIAIDWESAPEWANFCAEDFRQRFWWLECEPHPVDTSTNVSKSTQGRVSSVGTPNYFQATTVIKRPK